MSDWAPTDSALSRTPVVRLCAVVGAAVSLGAVLRVNPVLLGLLSGAIAHATLGDWRRRTRWIAALSLGVGLFYFAVVLPWKQRYESPTVTQACSHAMIRTESLTEDYVEQHPGTPLPQTTDPLEAMRQMGGEFGLHHCAADGGRHPMRFLGAGLVLDVPDGAYVPGQGPLIWVCPHPHRLGTCLVYRWPRQRERLAAHDLREALEREIRRGEAGEVGYSPAALELMRTEARLRLEPLDPPWWRWIGWPYR